MSKYEGHTPGPWEASTDGYGEWKRKANGYAGTIKAADGTHVFRGPASFWSLRGRTEQEADANARLIADAPKLLAQRDRLVQAVELFIAKNHSHDYAGAESEEMASLKAILSEIEKDA